MRRGIFAVDVPLGFSVLKRSSGPTFLGLLPACLALAFAAWWGTFPGGATFWGAALGALTVLAAAAWVRFGDLDPLRLGRWGRLLPLGLWATLIASAAVSVAPRAGRLALVLLPAYLSLPAFVERSLSGELARRWGLRAMAVVSGVVASWGLWDRFVDGSSRAAMPLGHHNLLAGFLVAMLPVAALGLREPGRWRLVAAAAAALTLAGIAAAGSLLAAVAVLVEGLLALLWWRGLQRLLLPAALLILGLQMPRVAAIFSGADSSANARWTYLEAGWRGVSLRPWLGWGPGSTAWTLGLHLRPVAGVNPQGEVVADLHSLPLQILYELGGVGFAFTLGTAAWFLRRRIRERPASNDEAMLAAGLLGLLGAAVTRLGGASLSVTAMPVAVALVAGVALSGGGERPRMDRRGPNDRAGAAAPSRRGLSWAYALAAILALAAPLWGQWSYESALVAARAGDGRAARRDLRRAVKADPSFPLYPVLLADRLPVDSNPGISEARDLLRQARRALDQAPGVAALWLSLAESSWRQEGRSALAVEGWRRACALDGLDGAAAALRLARGEPDAMQAAGYFARALLAEPRYVALFDRGGYEAVFPQALSLIERLESVDAGWRVRFLGQARELWPAERDDALRAGLGLSVDEVPALSPALHAFRRTPWPRALAAIAVDAALAAAVEVPPAMTLRGTRTGPGCWPGP
jgi:putative inorganic carbon (HCO3(-)) transporter